MIAATQLIPATCKNMCETSSRYWPHAWTLAEMMWQLQVWTNPNWRLRVCNLRNCLKPLPSSKQPGEEPQTKTVTHGVVLAARAKLVNHLHDNVCPAVRSHRHSDDRPAQNVGIAQQSPATTSATQRYGIASKVGQTTSTQRLSCVWSARTLGRRSSMPRSSC